MASHRQTPHDGLRSQTTLDELVTARIFGLEEKPVAFINSILFEGTRCTEYQRSGPVVCQYPLHRTAATALAIFLQLPKTDPLPKSASGSIYFLPSISPAHSPRYSDAGKSYRAALFHESHSVILGSLRSFFSHERFSKTRKSATAHFRPQPEPFFALCCRHDRNDQLLNQHKFPDLRDGLDLLKSEDIEKEGRLISHPLLLKALQRLRLSRDSANPTTPCFDKGMSTPFLNIGMTVPVYTTCIETSCQPASPRLDNASR